MEQSALFDRGSKDERYDLRVKSGCRLDVAISALQKAIRRGDEERALFYAIDVHEGGYYKYVWKRLGVIASEDIGIADSSIQVLVQACSAAFEKTVRKGQGGETTILAHAVLAMCRAPKNRMCDDAACLMLRRLDDGDFPDPGVAAIDCHTAPGKERLARVSSQTGRPVAELADIEFYLKGGAALKGEVTLEGIDWSMKWMERLGLGDRFEGYEAEENE